MGSLEVAKLGHVALEVPDLEGSLRFWRDIVGLEEVERREGEVYLRAWGDFEHHTLVLMRGEEAQLHHVAWRTRRPEDVEAFRDHLRAQGVEVEEVEPGAEAGQGYAIRFFVPTSGHPFEIYYQVEKPKAPEGLRSRLKNQVYPAFRRGVSPRRIDHVNLWTGGQDPTPTHDWLVEHLGFKVREYIQLPNLRLGAWMSVTPLVHDIAVMFDGATQGPRFHHVAYYLDNWQDVLRGLTIFKEHGILPDLGPGQHGISQAFYSYVRDPFSGHLLELFSGGYLILDPDWEPLEWRPEELVDGLFWWGDRWDPQTQPDHPFSRTTGVRRPGVRVG